MSETKQKSPAFVQTAWMLVGEAIVSLLICAGFLLAGIFFPGAFSYKVITGAVLGSAVTVLNFLGLSLAVDKAVNAFIEQRGEREMDEEEAAAFAQKHGMSVQNAVTKSYIVRTLTMIAALIVALITRLFDPIATVIPLLMYKPLIYIMEIIRRKRGAQ